MEIIITLLLSIIYYLAFPIIYRVKKGKVSESKAKKLALWNSIICEAINVVFGIAMNIEPNTLLFAQGFLYYFIAESILVDYNKKENEFENEKEKTNKE